MKLTKVLAGLLAASALLPQQSQAQDDITINGQLRVRFENLDNQFRAGKSGGDQLLLFRSLLHGKYQNDDLVVGLEFQDSRTYLGDAGTPLSSSFTNVSDLLQGYVTFKNLPGLLPDANNSQLTVGRQTISIGSKRQIERVSFANVIKSYTGVHYQTTTGNKDQLHAFYGVPIERLPKVRSEIDDNRFKSDKEQWQRRIWGLHYRNAKLFDAVADNNWGELFAYGFDESDTADTPTANRHYLTTGFRLYRPWHATRWNYDVEGAWRTGSRHATSGSNDNQDLDVNAKMLLFRVGYTFDHWLNPNIAFQHYYASGDKNPDDTRFDQFERLFGGRRTDLNNTSIHGPLTPANLSASGFRIELKPDSHWDARLHYSRAWLSSATDKFLIGKYHDPSGQSGDFVGHTIDTRLRVWFDGKRWIVDGGLSWLFPGDYLDNLKPAGGTTRFGYLQLSYQF